jgi:hypothetical protein
LSTKLLAHQAFGPGVKVLSCGNAKPVSNVNGLKSGEVLVNFLKNRGQEQELRGGVG